VLEMILDLYFYKLEKIGTAIEYDFNTIMITSFILAVVLGQVHSYLVS